MALEVHFNNFLINRQKKLFVVVVVHTNKDR